MCIVKICVVVGSIYFAWRAGLTKPNKWAEQFFQAKQAALQASMHKAFHIGAEFTVSNKWAEQYFKAGHLYQPKKGRDFTLSL